MSGGVGRHGEVALEKYLLPDLWCLHLFRDPIDLRVGDEQYAVVPGSVTLIPPNTPIEFHFPLPTRHQHIHALFVAHGPVAPFPAFQSPGKSFEGLYRSMEELTGWRVTNPLRAEVRLWDLLWTLSGQEGTATSGLPLDPLVAQVMEIIELRLGEDLSVARLAQELGVSHNHLTRQFKAHMGSTVVEFIRNRRVTRARHLLEHSNLPVKAIASQVGLGDYHGFNKVMRRVTGRSPRALRQ